MNFLNPGIFLLLAPLLALPIAIHLFNRRFPKTLLFPDLERIKKSLAERSKLMRWRHVLMTLLRTLAVLLALFAFLKPVISRFGSGDHRSDKSGREVLILLDRSFSMEQRAGAQTSAAKNAQVEIGKILATLGGEDKSNAILAGLRPKTLMPQFTSNHDALRASLATLPKSFEVANVEKAQALAGSVLAEHKGTVEIYIVSDFQRSNWADAAFDNLPKSARLFFIDAAEGKERGNTAILSAEMSATRVTAGEMVRVEIETANWTPDEAVIPVEAVIDGSASVAMDVRCVAWATGRGALEFRAPSKEGFHTIEVRTPDDGLPEDNHRHLRFEIRQKEEILVLSDASAEESGVLFVVTALDPYEDHGGPYAPRQLPVSALTSSQMASASRIIMTGARTLQNEEAVRLLGFLENGGGLIYFLNGAQDGGNLQMLEKVAGRTLAPFHLSGQLTAENFGGQPQKVAKGEFRSPFLRLFAGENRQALSRLEFYQLHRAFPTEEGQVILSFADGSPAMGVAQIGLGTAVFCNFAPAELASNLARERVFPAWLQEMVKNLAPDMVPETGREAGSSVTADIWRKDLEGGAITGPDGKAVAHTVATDGDRAQATFEAALPGIYQLGSAWADAVNVSATEADLRAIDTSELNERASESPAGGAHFVHGAEDYEELTGGRQISHWFVIALAVILFFEMLLHWPFHRPVA